MYVQQFCGDNRGLVVGEGLGISRASDNSTKVNHLLILGFIVKIFIAMKTSPHSSYSIKIYGNYKNKMSTETCFNIKIYILSKQ